jgi:Amt family ammonium transporter
MGQLSTQALGLGATVLLAAAGTFLICFAVEKTIGFRLSDSEEKAGLDHSIHGESGYGMLNLH